jgi:predicted Fe-Mo cluster-binding NifX family protein
VNVCIPTLDDTGLTGKPSDHFGSAPYFTFVDTENGNLEVVRNGGEHHVHGACQPLRYLAKRPVDAILCRGLGRRAFARLRTEGIQVFVTLEKDVSETLKALHEDRLRLLTSEEACHGHGGGGGHGHSGGHGRGRRHQAGEVPAGSGL